MIVELLHKEYRENLGFKKDLSIFKKLLKIFGTLLGLAFFATFEVYLFSALDKKLVEFSSYGSLDFLILFLLILLIFSIFASLIKARNVFYKKSDSAILLHLPVDNDEVIISKTLFVFIYSVMVNFIISVPLLCTYGATRGIEDGIFPRFYILSFLYPVFVSFFTSGVVLMLLPLYNKIYTSIKNKAVIQIVLGSVLVITLCFLYQYVLDLFLNLISNSKFDSLFSADFLASLHVVSPFLFPVSGLVNMTHIKDNLVSNITISFGVSLFVLLIGFIISSIGYTKYLKNEFSQNKSYHKAKSIKINKFSKSLLKKEFVLIFRNSNYVFSYTSLLIMQPFLAFVVISSLNSLLYENMKMFLAYFPELINGMNILLLLLFSSIISSSSLDSYTREGKEITIVKYLPISPIKQSYIKILIPLIFSSFSLIITNIILVSFGSISVLCFFISLFLGLLLQVALSFGGIYIDLMKLDIDQKNDLGYLGTVISVVLPVLIFIIHLVMTYFNLNVGLMYSLEVLFMLLILVALILPFKRIVNNYFIKMRIN